MHNCYAYNRHVEKKGEQGETPKATQKGRPEHDRASEDGSKRIDKEDSTVKGKWYIYLEEASARAGMRCLAPTYS